MTFDEYKMKLIAEIKRLCSGDSFCDELLNENGNPARFDRYVQFGIDNDFAPEDVAWALVQ